MSRLQDTYDRAEQQRKQLADMNQVSEVTPQTTITERLSMVADNNAYQAAQLAEKLADNIVRILGPDALPGHAGIDPQEPADTHLGAVERSLESTAQHLGRIAGLVHVLEKI